MKYPLKLSYKGNSWKARLIKKAVFSTGYVVYFFERAMNPDKPVIGFQPFIVAVKSPLDHTVEFNKFITCKQACEYYLNAVCCYA